MSKYFAAAIMAAGLAGGCSTSVTSPQPSSTSAADAGSQTAIAPADAFANGSRSKQLDVALASLKSMVDDGTLTSDEYTRARAREIKAFCENWGPQNVNALMVHDEVGYLAQVNKEHRLSDEEFKQAKSAVVNAYLAQ